jgi:hypothetical protein
MTDFGIDGYDSRITVTTYPKNDTTYDSELESKKGLGNHMATTSIRARQ